MILGIESSCDESAMACFSPEVGLQGEWVASQIALHQAYGGVVPDIASREHLEHFGPMLDRLTESTPTSSLTALAVTHGPGLAGCLAMGVAVAKALSLAWKLPVSPVNHLRGHAWSPFIALHAESPATFQERLSEALPHLGLIVSGGNTLLVCITAERAIRVVAQTVDDAAGEALDKGAKLLGKPYPGGPLMEQLASGGDASRFDFPRGLTTKTDMRFSFSGLKTALRYRLEAMSDAELEAALPDLCASYQSAVIDQLSLKLKHALKANPYRSLGLSGGVANNGRLRKRLSQLADGHKLPLFLAQPKHTGDNAAMIAFAAWLDPLSQPVASLSELDIHPSATVDESARKVS